MITDEKRAFKRVRKKFEVTHEVHSSGGERHGKSISENISLGGVYFTSLEQFQIGEMLDCSIKIPGQAEEGKWTARVVRCEGLPGKMISMYGVAVEFVEAFGNSEKNLKKILSKK